MACRLRQSYLRIAKLAAMMAGRYAHAKQFKRYRQQLRLLRTRLGRLIRDIRRKIAGRREVEAAFERPLSRAAQIRSQEQRQRGYKLYSFHAPEVECIGKGKAWRLTSSASRPRSSPPIPVPRGASSCCTPRRYRATHMMATRSARSSKPPRTSPAARSSAPMSTRAIAVTKRQTRGASSFSGQKRGVFGVIKRELRRRSAIEPVIGHMKTDGHLGRCYLKGREGDAANAVLTAVGHDLRLVLACSGFCCA